MKLFTYLLLSGFILVGCQAANEGTENEQVRVNQTTPENQTEKFEKMDNQTAHEIAERLVNLAIKVPGVNDATAVVFRRYAIVGIDVGAKIDRARVGTIKYTVAEALQEDPFGANSIVTADPDTMQRLREIAADVGNGRPVEGFAEELGDILGRWMPQLPHRTQPNNETNHQMNQPNQP